MGIALNALSIIVGTILGSLFKKTIKLNNLAIFGVGIMIISIVGFFENIFDVSDMVLKSNELLIVVFSLITGSVIGECLKIDARLNNMAAMFKGGISGIVDASVFFGIGGSRTECNAGKPALNKSSGY